MSYLFSNFVETSVDTVYEKMSPLSLFTNHQSVSQPTVVAPLPTPEKISKKDSLKYQNLESEIEKLKKLNLEDKTQLERFEMEIENLKNLNKSHVNTINQLSSELNTIRLKDQELINSQVSTINQLSSELNSLRTKNIFNSMPSNEESNKVNDVASKSEVLSKRIAALESNIKELEKLNNSHVATITELNSELSQLRSNDCSSELKLFKAKVEELNMYNQQILVHNNNLARRLMQIQSSRY